LTLLLPGSKPRTSMSSVCADAAGRQCKRHGARALCCGSLISESRTRASNSRKARWSIVWHATLPLAQMRDSCLSPLPSVAADSRYSACRRKANDGVLGNADARHKQGRLAERRREEHPRKHPG
jgi:hypothetical protein